MAIKMTSLKESPKRRVEAKKNTNVDNVKNTKSGARFRNFLSKKSFFSSSILVVLVPVNVL